MILCGEMTDVGGGNVGIGGVYPPPPAPRKDITQWEERAGRVKNKYKSISDGAWVPEGSLSKVRTPPPHNYDTPHILVNSNTHTHQTTSIAGRGA